MMLPVCSMGGLLAISRTRSSLAPLPQLDFTRPKMCTMLPDPWVRWILPEPVETESSTCPFTVRLRSNVASEASDGIVARARTAVAIQKRFIVFLDSNADVSDQLPVQFTSEFPVVGEGMSILCIPKLHPACQ